MWQTEAVEGDPRVFVSENIDPNKWFIEDERLCGFIYQQLLFEAIMNCKYNCTTSWIDCGKLDLIVDRWKKAPFKPMRWPEYPAEFYYKDKAIAFTYPNENGFTFHCGSNKPLELCFMVDLIDDTWEDVHIG